MRKIYSVIMKEVTYKNLTAYKTKSKCTIARLAEVLSIDPRSCSDLCRGKSTFSALSLIRYLIYCCDDVDALLAEMKQKFESAEENDGADVA